MDFVLSQISSNRLTEDEESIAEVNLDFASLNTFLGGFPLYNAVLHFVRIQSVSVNYILMISLKVLDFVNKSHDLIHIL